MKDNCYSINLQITGYMLKKFLLLLLHMIFQRNFEGTHK